MADLKISALTASTTPLAGTEVLPIVQSSTTKQVSVANLTAGRVVSVGNLNIPLGSAAAPSIYATGDNTSGIYASAAGATSFSFAGYICGEFTSANGYWNLYRRNATSQYLETSVNSSGANILVSASAGVLNLGIGSTSYLTISGAGDVSLPSTNLVVSNGKGIDFSATPGTGTSELLADYEEGTWTPTVAANSGAITSYTSSGTYTKIGRQVTLMITFTITNNGTGSGDIRITNLPFTNSADNLGNGCGRENATGGFMVNAILSASGTIAVYQYNNSYPGGTGNSIKMMFTYFV
jgi:hypothetical protein